MSETLKQSALQSDVAKIAKTATQSLDAKYDLTQDHVLLNGAQAIVRLALTQRHRDDAAGHNTAGYVTGYRGSPIAGLESQFARAGDRIVGVA